MSITPTSAHRPDKSLAARLSTPAVRPALQLAVVELVTENGVDAGRQSESQVMIDEELPEIEFSPLSRG